jgi:acetyl-CoA synthetase
MFENQIKPRSTNPVLASYDKTCASFSWEQANAEFTWHKTGRLNIAHEAIGRFAANPATADQPCLIYALGERREVFSYAAMHRLSNRFGNVLRSLGVGRGDRVFLFLSNFPELYIALAGCAKIGAVIVPLYAQFRTAALRDRMLDAQGAVLVTTRAHRSHIPAEELPDLKHIIIVNGQGAGTDDGETLWEDEMARVTEELDMEWLEAEAPLFLIYTSGQDGSPIGLVHVHDAMRGYLMTARWALDLKPGDVLWTQAQPGWFMNVVYTAFAPWLCGVASFITGRLTSAEEFYSHVQENKISVVYTIPAIYRILADAGLDAAQRFSLKSLRHLVSVLEPLYPDLIYRLMRILDMPLHDTWWTAETGMITIANFPCLPIKPGYLGKPMPGLDIKVFEPDGKEPPPFTMGDLAIKQGWPAMARGIWRNHEAFSQFMRRPPWLMLNDTAFVDYDGYFFHQGRTDDVIITAAGKTGFAEIEKALTEHPAVAEAAVIRSIEEHGRKKIKAFIALKANHSRSPLLKKKIMAYLLKMLDPDLALAEIEFRDSLPRNKAGVIMRRVLKAWELGLPVGRVQ